MRIFRLTHAAAVAALAIGLLAPAIAHGQPGAPPPPPPPGGNYYGNNGGYGAPAPHHGGAQFFNRRGFTLGFGIGIGGMSSAEGAIQCADCDYQPASVGFDFHAGAMINPRLALLGEVWGTGQAVDANGRTTLIQTLVMFAAQYWLTPQLWVKGGIGAANLSYSIDDGYDATSQDIDSGAALMGAIGYEIMSGRRFAIDLQGRIGTGTYDGINDQITSGTVSVGFNWF